MQQRPMKLSSISTKHPEGIAKEVTKKKTVAILQEIKDLQKILFAQAKYSILIILQGLDASGKDGVVNKVFSGLNPLGVDVKSFKAPTAEELRYDFLWRVHQKVPQKGQIMIFNRSHYEDVLVPQVEGWIGGSEIKKRYRYINDFEELIESNNTIILKFYLHISQEEQHIRLEERKTNPEKFWKHNDGDWETSKKWKQYMEAYEAIFEECNRPDWEIVPSDQNWYKEHFIASKLLDTLKGIKLEFPTLL